jgi:hypothetical protein
MRSIRGTAIRLGALVGVLALGGLAVLAPTATAQPTRAGLVVLSHSAVFSPATGQVTFTVTFNRAPDFESVDALGRQADSFQYFIYGDMSLPYPAYYDAIIRGEELHITSPLLRVRDAVGTDPDPASGGWGPVRGAVPYRLEGNVLTFSTPLALISDHSVDGHFSYDLMTTRYGGDPTLFYRGESVVVDGPGPGPTAKEQCKNGGWRNFGVFKNQGDCVSFVATGGNNPPAGP